MTKLQPSPQRKSMHIWSQIESEGSYSFTPIASDTNPLQQYPGMPAVNPTPAWMATCLSKLQRSYLSSTERVIPRAGHRGLFHDILQSQWTSSHSFWCRSFGLKTTGLIISSLGILLILLANTDSGCGVVPIHNHFRTPFQSILVVPDRLHAGRKL